MTDSSSRVAGCEPVEPAAITGVAGEPARIEHVDGTIVESRFPVEIDPAQPFMQMREIAHSVAPGITATCRMEGDAFEMEDQRNWTDASYKTYVRPLALPWPYTLPANTAARQTITLTLAGEPRDQAGESTGPVAVSLGEVRGAAPAFGLVVTPEETAATLAAIDWLRRLAPQHLALVTSDGRTSGERVLEAVVDIFVAGLASPPAADTPARRREQSRPRRRVNGTSAGRPA